MPISAIPPFLFMFEALKYDMLNKVTFIILFFQMPLLVFAQDDSQVIKKMSDDIMRNAAAYENLRFLCKKIGPRLSGSSNAQKAVEATARMLAVAGADTVYLQPCMVPHWERGAKETGILKTSGGVNRKLQLCALGNSIGTGPTGVTGTVIEVKSFAELDSLGQEGIKGKIVFFNFEMNPTYIETFRAYGESGVSRVSGPSKAAKYGAIAAMVRSLASNPDDYPHTGVTIYNDSFPKIPAVAISTNDAIWISGQLQINRQVKAFVKTNCRMLPDAPSFNVVGEIKGREFAEQVITVGGHLDSWDLGEGANDDGAGVVQSIEVIRALKAAGIVPKRTIRAVMFMNEENGGRGGEKYAELAKLKREQHLFALESDAGGFTPRAISFEVKDSIFQKIKSWEKLFAPYGVYRFTRGGSGADVGHLRSVNAALAGLSPDSQRYFDIHHAASDVFENVSRRELHLGAVNMAAIIYLVDKYGL